MRGDLVSGFNDQIRERLDAARGAKAPAKAPARKKAAAKKKAAPPAETSDDDES